jgi:mRNA interferase RelE/StbE
MIMKIRMKKTARKELRALEKRTQIRIAKALRPLRSNPRPPGSVKLKGRDEYRIRVGDYRVIYEIQDDVLIVLLVKIAHRSNVYR